MDKQIVYTVTADTVHGPGVTKVIALGEPEKAAIAEALNIAYSFGLQEGQAQRSTEPIPMLLWCPECGARHIDVALYDKPHHTHACQDCGMCWRPAVVPTVGVSFLPGFKD